MLVTGRHMIIPQISLLHRPIQSRFSTSIARNIISSIISLHNPARAQRIVSRLKYSPARCRREKSCRSAPSKPLRPLLNDSRLLFYITALGTVFAFVVLRNSPLSEPALSSQPDASAQFAPRHQGLQIGNMPTELAPGRPDNLTEEQEIKLREFWQELLELFGVWNSSDEKTTGENSVAASRAHSSAASQDSAQQSPVTTDGKKHKSKLNPFSRKHKGHGSDNSSLPNGDINSGGDKHGLNLSFREALAQQSPEELRHFFWDMIKHDNPDAILLRFLRARKWNVQAALIMLISALRWRSVEMNVDDDILKSGEAGALAAASSSDPKNKKEAEDFLQQLRLGKSFLHGYDSEGRPICMVRVKLHRQGEQSEPSLERFTVYTLETARLLLRSPIDTATLVFDMTGFTMANMDYTPVKFIIKCFEANYPESLGAVIVYRAPWIFQSIWAIIRGWLDPVVAGKVHFAKTIDDLSIFIPRDRIPRELDGDEDFSYAYIEPTPNENASMDDAVTRDNLISERNDLITKFENVTKRWINGDSVASVDDAAYNQSSTVSRRDIDTQLRTNYWRLDPYIRARSLYDRLGIIQPNGVLQPA